MGGGCGAQAAHEARNGTQPRADIGRIQPYIERRGRRLAGMSLPASRILALLELLQSRGQLDGAAIAAELQVERRTVRRYIVALEALGIPVDRERGRFGGYRLATGFRLPPLMFSEDEALALGLGLLAARQLGLADAAPAVASAQAKLDSAQQSVGMIGRKVNVTTSSGPQSGTITAVDLSGGTPSFTLTTSGSTLTGITFSQISSVQQ